MTKTHRLRPRALSFALHYLQMVIAMAVGMMVLYPLWQPAVGRQPESAWVHRADVDSGGLMLLGHVLMLLFMLAAMLARPGEYSGSHTRHAHAAADREPA
ncbi:MAG: hypothetical protein M3306_27655 [Actinomycetota bacterium]|nr:hypothetical protein [Actinomycetota bacterium]